jgi:hypothetical protein
MAFFGGMLDVMGFGKKIEQQAIRNVNREDNCPKVYSN